MSLLIRRSASHHRDAGWGREEDRARTAAAGFDGHLVKPVDLDMLARLLGGRPLGIDRLGGKLPFAYDQFGRHVATAPRPTCLRSLRRCRGSSSSICRSIAAPRCAECS